MDRHEATNLAIVLEPAVILSVHYDTLETIEADANAMVRKLEENGIGAEVM